MNKFALVGLCLAFCSCAVSFNKEKPKSKMIAVQIAYKDVSNELNTFEGWYKREIEEGRFAQTKIELSNDEQVLILNKAIVTQFFHLGDTLSKRPKSGRGEHFLQIKADSLDKRVIWYGDMLAPAVGATRLPELMFYIDSIVSAREEVKQLPPAHAGS